MKICVLVKEVPDAAVEKRINASTGRLDRSGEKNLNPFDTHAIEAAMQLKEGGAIDIDEVVAVTMGPSIRESISRESKLRQRQGSVAVSQTNAPVRTQTALVSHPESKRLSLRSSDGRLYQIDLKLEGAPAYIGRAAGNAVRIDDPSISRLHCSLRSVAAAEH